MTTNTKPTTWQEAKDAGGVWVYDNQHHWQPAGFERGYALLGTVDEPQDEYGFGSESDDEYCSLQVIQVLQGAGPQGQILDGVKVSALRRPDTAERTRVWGDLWDEAENLRNQAAELGRMAELVLQSPIEEDS